MAVQSPPPPALESIDQQVRLSDIGWDDYERVLAMRGDSSALRVTYFEGELQIMTPSSRHERDKKRLSRLIEAFAEETGLDLEGYGSWTIQNRLTRSGAEADECYVVGDHDEEELEAPHLAIEVVYSSGGIDKLAVWRALGVREVWIWQKEELRFFVLREGGYEAAPHSEVLPTLDAEVLARFMTSESSQTVAVRHFREALRSR